MYYVITTEHKTIMRSGTSTWTDHAGVRQTKTTSTPDTVEYLRAEKFRALQDAQLYKQAHGGVITRTME